MTRKEIDIYNRQVVKSEISRFWLAHYRATGVKLKIKDIKVEMLDMDRIVKFIKSYSV